MRYGFTIIELLVAIVILTVGLLALAGTAGLVASHVGDGGRLTSAAQAARSIIDSLATRDCATIASGTSTRGVSVSWTASRDSSAVTIDVAVGSRLRHGSRRDAYQAIVPCGAP